MNGATPNQQAKQTSSSGYDLAKPQIKMEEESKDYDRLEHLNKKPDEELDSNDTYAHANIEDNDNNDTYSHAQSGQLFQTNMSTKVQDEPDDDTYEHAKCVGYDDSDTYDHSNKSGTKEESSDYGYTHEQNVTVTDGDYDLAGFLERNANDTYE